MNTKYLKNKTDDLYKGSHKLVVESAKKNNVVAISIINTKKLNNSELSFVCEILINHSGYIFYDVERDDKRNKYIFIKPYTDEKFEIID